MSLCVMLIIIIHIIALMGMMSCSTHRHAVTVEREMHTDTVYVTRQQYDSIFIWKDRWTDRTHDTVYMKELSTEYRYRLLRDTLRIVERDSVPYEVVRTETREVERPLSWFDKIARAVFWIVTGAVVIGVVSWMAKKGGVGKWLW